MPIASLPTAMRRDASRDMPHDEMTRQTDTFDLEAEPFAEFDVQHRQCDRQSFAIIENRSESLALP